MNELLNVAIDRTSEGHTRFLGPTMPTAQQFKFVTECFFITQRALHVGLLPAVNTFTKMTSDLGRQLKAEGEESSKGMVLKKLYVVSKMYRTDL